MGGISGVSGISSGMAAFSEPIFLLDQLKQMLALKQEAKQSPADQFMANAISKFQLLQTSSASTMDQFKALQDASNHIDAFLEHLGPQYFKEAKGEIDPSVLTELHDSLFSFSKKVSSKTSLMGTDKKLLLQRLAQYKANGINTIDDMIAVIRIMEMLGGALPPAFVNLMKDQIALFVKGEAASTTDLRSFITFMAIAEEFLSNFDESLMPEESVSASVDLGVESGGVAVDESLASSVEALGISFDQIESVDDELSNDFSFAPGAALNAYQGQGGALADKKRDRTTLSDLVSAGSQSAKKGHVVKSVDRSQKSGYDKHYQDPSLISQNKVEGDDQDVSDADGAFEKGSIKDVLVSFSVEHKDVFIDESLHLFKTYLEIELNRTLPDLDDLKL